VIAAGGWDEVFPMDMVFPEWASRVRNFFNVTPVTLERVAPDDHGKHQIKNRRGYNIWIPPVFQRYAFALNGDVYADEHGRPWFEMDKIGALYHLPFPSNVPLPTKIAVVAVMPYSKISVFKLISPDGDTGGSLELCVYNVNHTKDIAQVGEEVLVSPRLVRDVVYRGSYNYAETVVRGDDEHTHRDVTPHREDEGFYVNPPLYSSIASRRFPATAGGKSLGFEAFRAY
jgi:hypothetical protein